MSVRIRCSVPRCPNQHPCPTHRRRHDRYRGSAASRGYDYRWEKFAAWFKRQVDCPECGRNHALCEGECREKGLVVASYAVDHIVPHRGDPEIFNDHRNLRGLCRREHNSKSARERLGE